MKSVGKLNSRSTSGNKVFSLCQTMHVFKYTIPEAHSHTHIKPHAHTRAHLLRHSPTRTQTHIAYTRTYMEVLEYKIGDPLFRTCLLLLLEALTLVS